MKEKKNYLKKHQRLCAHLIAESLGYLVPDFAARMLKSVHNKEEFFCEWTYDIHLRSGQNMIDISHNIVKAAIRNRHEHRGSMSSYIRARNVINRELSGKEVEFASWF